jgi:hypothetical protein
MNKPSEILTELLNARAKAFEIFDLCECGIENDTIICIHNIACEEAEKALDKWLLGGTKHKWDFDYSNVTALLAEIQNLSQQINLPEYIPDQHIYGFTDDEPSEVIIRPSYNRPAKLQDIMVLEERLLKKLGDK